MKKLLSEKALAKEAALWSKLSQAAKNHPGITCHK
jgi:hypothetical protein